MDPIIARRVLRIFPDAPLTADLIERAYAGESAARHPSRYPEGPDRAHAEVWARTLGTARAILLAEISTAAAPPAPVVPPVEPVTAVAPAAPSASVPAPHAPIPVPGPDLAAAVNAPRRRGLSLGAIIGIAGAAVALVLLVVAGVAGVTALVNTVNEATRALETELASPPGADDTSADDDELPDVDRYTADETFFTFPAAVELYYDGRYNGECPMEYAEGCWQAAIVTESDCDALQVQLGFANDPDASAPEHIESVDFANVIAGETTPVVFGQDEYDNGWLNNVRCLD